MVAISIIAVVAIVAIVVAQLVSDDRAACAAQTAANHGARLAAHFVTDSRTCGAAETTADRVFQRVVCQRRSGQPQQDHC